MGVRGQIGGRTLLLAAMPAAAGLLAAGVAFAVPPACLPMALAAIGLGVSWLALLGLLSRQKVLVRLTEARAEARDERRNLYRQIDLNY